MPRWDDTAGQFAQCTKRLPCKTFWVKGADLAGQVPPEIPAAQARWVTTVDAKTLDVLYNARPGSARKLENEKDLETTVWWDPGPYKGVKKKRASGAI